MAPVNDEARRHNKSLPGQGGVYNLVNLQLYHYAGNNPVKYVDPDGEDHIYYDTEGNYIETRTSETNNVYVRETTINEETGEQETNDVFVASIDTFNEFTAAVYGESSGNAEESNAIADVIMNRVDYSGRSITDIVENTGIYGYNANSLNTVRNGSTSNDNSSLVNARAAVIDAITGNADSSNGAYFWEGNRFLNNDNNNFFRRGLNTNPPIFTITTTIGGTTFMRYNPDHPRYGRNVWP